MAVRIDKAVITAAGPGQNTLPLQRLVDRDGVEKSALELTIEEVAAAGIDEIGIVIRDGDQDAYQNAAGKLVDRLHFLIQKEPRGYGDAVLCSEPFAKGNNVLHLVGDHIFLSYSNRRCAQQLLDVARTEGCCVSAVQPTREMMLPYFGAVAGQRLPSHDNLFEVKLVMEKPTPKPGMTIVAACGRERYNAYIALARQEPRRHCISGRSLERGKDMVLL